MKLTVLVDNNTLIDQYYGGEPGLCFYIEDNDTRCLWDAGYTDLCISNALKMGITLSRLDVLAFSHGHNDHIGGLPHLLERFDCRQMQLVAHPDTFLPKRLHGQMIGSLLSAQDLQSRCRLHLSKGPVWLTQQLVFLGEIPRTTEFEATRAIGQVKHGNVWREDFLLDDSALVWCSAKGLVIITGCAHSGICNIIEAAKTVCGTTQIAAVIGGFHLSELGPQVEQTIQYLKRHRIDQLYPCHCVSFAVKSAIHQQIPIQEVGVGMHLEW